MKLYKPLKEMALLDKDNFFINYHKAISKNPDVNYWNIKGWDDLRKYYKDVKKTYENTSSPDETFSDWFRLEYLNLRKNDWKKIVPEIQRSMIEFFRKLDSDPTLLDKKEKLL